MLYHAIAIFGSIGKDLN